MLQINLQHTKINFNLDVNISIPNTGITAIYGNSGSGKTSLLRIIAGLDRVSNTSIIFNDLIWQNQYQFLPTYKRNIAYVFQENNLFHHLTVIKNLRAASSRSGTTEADLLKISRELGINHLLHRIPHNLSGGEKQRIAITRAILCKPQLLLLDEPFSALDDENKHSLLKLLLDLQQQIPILYVSHSLNEIMTIANYIVNLKHGKVVAHGPIK